MAQRKVFHFNDVFDTMVYPAGEPHVRLKQFKPDALPGDTSVGYELRALAPYFRPFIISQAKDWNGIMQVVIADEVLKQNGIEATFVIPYFPFARHDRKNDELDSNPVPWVLQLLKDVAVVCIDPHSDVAGVLPHFGQSEVVRAFSEAGIFRGDAVVAIPDAGATKKAYEWLNGRTAVQCLKTRDTKTGKLSGFQVINPELVKDRIVVIIDDICDGGGTFLGLADELHDAGAQSLRLGVTHGLFTKGLTDLFARYGNIYTLDTCETSEWGNLMTVSTEQLVQEGKYF